MRSLAIKSLLAATMGLGFAASASAADLPAKAPVAPAPVAVYNWSGLYIGGHIGGGWANTNWQSDFDCAVGILCGNVDQNSNGWIGGGQVGYRWQKGPWVFGVEGTFAGANLDANDPSTCTPGVNTCIGIPGGFDVHFETKIRSLYTVTGQVGYAWDRLLLYGKGGWAGAEVRRNSADILGAPAAQFFDKITQKANGWTAGAGLEYLVWQNISLGVEYDYFKLTAGNFVTNAVSGTGAPAFLQFSSGLDAHVHQVVARLNFKIFNFR